MHAARVSICEGKVDSFGEEDGVLCVPYMLCVLCIMLMHIHSKGRCRSPHEDKVNSYEEEAHEDSAALDCQLAAVQLPSAGEAAARVHNGEAVQHWTKAASAIATPLQ